MKKAMKILKNMDIYVGSFFFIIMVLVIIANVTMRYVFRTGLSWSEELILILFAWSSYMGIVAAYRYDRHVKVDIVYKMFPLKLQKVIDIITDIGILVLSSYVTYLALVLCSNAGRKRTLVMRLPINVVNSCLVVAFALISVSAIYRIVTKIKGTYVLEDAFESPLETQDALE